MKCIISDTISEDTFLTNRIYTLSLCKAPAYWADYALNHKELNSKPHSDLEDFDMMTCVEKLVRVYRGASMSQRAYNSKRNIIAGLIQQLF